MITIGSNWTFRTLSDGSDIIVKNRCYIGTQGLYEQVFKKNCNYFSKEN